MDDSEEDDGFDFYADVPLTSAADTHSKRSRQDPMQAAAEDGKADSGKTDTRVFDLTDDASTTITAPHPSYSASDISLSQAQFKAISMLLQRRSIFFTGAAGTGKSYILKLLKDVLETLQFDSKIAFTAPTGVAACNIGGTTIHAWSGVGIAADSFDKIFAKISGNAMLKRKWKLTEILVIDEISMLSAELFDMISEIGSRIRGDDRPFGGMQVILCGDFFQLPPIGVTKFCFESKSWSLLLGADGTIVLDKVFRQKDSLFQRLLNNLRRGVVIPEDGALLQHMSSETGAAKTYPTGIKPTLLYATNKGVDEINTSSLNNLEGEEVAYQAIDAPEDSPFMAVLRSGMKAPELLRLKIGAQVMMLKNQDVEQGLVNGARGVVTDFTNARKTSIGMISLPIVTFIVKIGGKEVTKVVEVEPSTWDLQQGNRVVASRVQIPLMLAWAISIHKSQGMTIPYLNVSFRGMFEYGQAYVALSRATDLDGLSISGYSTKSIKAHPLVAKYYDRLGYSTESVHKDEETVVVDIQQLASQFVRDLPAYERKKDEWFTAHNRGAYGPPPSARQPAVNPAKPVYSIFKNVPQVSPVVSSAPVTAKTLPTSSGLPYASTSATISAPAHPASSSSVNFVSDRSSSAISSSLYSFKYNTPSSSSTSAAVSVTPITPVSSSLTEEQKRRIQENRERALMKRKLA